MIRSFFLLVFIFSGTAAYADVVESKNGQLLEGLITRESDKEIAINVDGVELTMSRSEVASVEKRPLPKKVEPKVPEAPKTEPAAAVPADSASSVAADAAPESPAPGMEPAASEFPILVFDKRNWILGNQGQSAQGLTAEFVLENETVQNWTELVTAQFFPGLQAKAMPVDFGYITKNELQKICPNVDWRLLGTSQNEALFQWSVQGCQAQPDQMEIVRVIRGSLGMHAIHYAVKKSTLPDEERLKWIERLGRAKLVKK